MVLQNFSLASYASDLVHISNQASLLPKGLELQGWLNGLNYEDQGYLDILSSR